MMRQWALLLLAVLLVVGNNCNGERVRYDNHQVLEVKPSSEENAKFLHDFMSTNAKYDFWKEMNSMYDSAHVMVTPENKEEFLNALEGAGIKHSIFMNNIQSHIDNETLKSYTKSTVRNFDWISYHTLDDIYLWLEVLEEDNRAVVKRVVGGKTYEGRDIVGVKISHAPNRRAIFVESGTHAREWIAPATATYLINELVYSTDTAVRNLANSYDWYIFPSTNPDGYVYSHTHERLWRKTRSQQASGHFGVDTNRNWNYKWNTEGTSNNPSDSTYGGRGPFSEIETRSLSDFIRNVSRDLDIYLSFHSYGQLLLTPYGTSGDIASNYGDMLSIGRKAAEALRQRYNTDYSVGSFAETLYPASGTSTDWVKATLDVPLVYLYEFRDRGSHAFILPPDQIIPNSLEVLDSLVALVEFGKSASILN